jgi:gliding motility-associated-like protein
MCRYVLYVLLILSSTICTAQVNLINNSDLEIPDSTFCSLAISFNYFTNLWSPINTSPDYLNKCNLSIPYDNIAGFQEDYKLENGYIGLSTYFSPDTTYREYIMIKLNEILQKNKKYIIVYLVSNSDFLDFSTNIGCCLEKDSVNGLVQNNFIPTYPDYTFMTDSIISDCNNWTEVSFEFIPTIADLQYLVIGAFPETKPLLIQNHIPINHCSPVSSTDTRGAYYIIDNIRLYCLDCDTSSTCALALPDAYTPNADGLNDEWKPLINTDCDADIDNYLLRIFNRWGEVVFTTHDKNETWKGINNEIGTYVYYLQYDDRGKIQIKQGNVELIR